MTQTRHVKAADLRYGMTLIREHRNPATPADRLPLLAGDVNPTEDTPGTIEAPTTWGTLTIPADQDVTILNDYADRERMVHAARALMFPAKPHQASEDRAQGQAELIREMRPVPGEPADGLIAVDDLVRALTADDWDGTLPDRR